MRAVLYTGGKKPWADCLGDRPWALLPVASRPLLSYWLELCVDLGIVDVQIVLGRDAEYIEMFCGNGEKWGLSISYSFVRDEDEPRGYLSRDPQRWNGGLLYIGEAMFPRRQAGFTPEKVQTLSEGCCLSAGGRCTFFIAKQPEAIQHFIRTGECSSSMSCADPCGGGGPCRIPATCGLDFTVIRDITHYYQLNMEIVRNEMDRYLSSGYSSGGYSSSDHASIGYNVITPPSVSLTPPLAIGNDCRIGAISSVGAGTVISDHVLIDRQCEISDSIILSDTYIGRNLEITGKIVSGNRIVDPLDGTCLEIEDPWLVAHTRPRNYMRDALRAVCCWQIALLLFVLQSIPFILLYALIRLLGRGRYVVRDCWGIEGNPIRVARFVSTTPVPCLLLMLFYGTSLDRFPQLTNVLRGQLWLCGQVPKPVSGGELKEKHLYFPAVFSYSDAFVEIDKQMDALYYAHTRSLASDLRILRHALFSRLIEVETLSGPVVQSA